MKYRNAGRALSAAILVALSSGCAASGINPAAPANAAAVAPSVQRPFAQAASKIPPVLVYAVDGGSGQVQALAYPSFRLFKDLTQSGTPACSDANGNVWFVSGQQLVEYAHGGTQPIATLNDAGEYPQSCAVSSKTGNLAVGNVLSTGGGSGSIAIYKHAKGNPIVVQSTGRVYSVTYDSNDDLFADGTGSSSAFALLELPSGSKNIESIALEGATIQFPGGLQYVGEALNVGDQASSVIYQAHVKGTIATVTGQTPLTGSSDVVSFAIYKNRVVCADAGNADLTVYAYPKGGNPVKTVTGFSEPTGVVISAVPQ